MDFLPKVNYTYVAIAIVVIILLVYLYKRKLKSKNTEKMSGKKKSKVPVLDDKTDEDDSEEDKVESLSKVLYKKLHKGFSNDNMDVEKFNKLSMNKVPAAVFTDLTMLYNEAREKDEDFDDITEKNYRKIIKMHVV